MAKKHLFSLNAPKNWPIERKKQIWLTRPNPGPHPLNRCLPLSILLRNVLKYARTMREVKTILNEGGILIDSKVRKDYKFPVGLMDVVEVKKTNEFFRLILDENNKYSLILIQRAVCLRVCPNQPNSLLYFLFSLFPAVSLPFS